MMEDDKIKELFDSFEPRLDTAFMRKLELRLDAVELVKARQRELRARSRRACVAAVVAGFAAGFASALAMPYVTAAVQSIHLNLPAAYEMLPGWIAMAVATIMASLTVYNVLLTMEREKIGG